MVKKVNFAASMGCFALLSACVGTSESESAPRGFVDEDGRPQDGVDLLRRTWKHIGNTQELYPIRGVEPHHVEPGRVLREESSLGDEASGDTGVAPEGEVEPVEIVDIATGDVFRLVGSDSAAEAAWATSFESWVANAVGAGDAIDEETPGSRAGIVWAPDSRVPLADDATRTPDGNFTALKAVRFYANPPGPTEGVAQCTGSLIAHPDWSDSSSRSYTGRQVVMTAAHCVWDQGIIIEDDPNSSSAVPKMVVCAEDVVWGENLADNDVEDELDLAPFDSNCREVTHVAVNPAYKASQTFANDWAMLFLASPSRLGTNGEEYFLDITLDNEDYNDTINHMAMNGDSDPDFILHSGCTIKDVLQKRLAYNCDTEGGQSGGPIYKFNASTDQRTLIAVHDGFGGSWNTGSRVAFWLPEMEDLLIAPLMGTVTSDVDWQDL